MDSRTPTEEYCDDSSGSFEVITALGRELRLANERIKSLEEALSQVSYGSGLRAW